MTAAAMTASLCYGALSDEAPELKIQEPYEPSICTFKKEMKTLFNSLSISLDARTHHRVVLSENRRVSIICRKWPSTRIAIPTGRKRLNGMLSTRHRIGCNALITWRILSSGEAYSGDLSFWDPCSSHRLKNLIAEALDEGICKPHTPHYSHLAVKLDFGSFEKLEPRSRSYTWMAR